MSEDYTVIHFDKEATQDLQLRLQVLTGMDAWTGSQIARRAISLLKDDLADRLKEQGEWEEYQEAAQNKDSLSEDDNQ